MTLGSDIVKYGVMGMGQGLMGSILNQNKVEYEEPIVIIKLQTLQALRNDLIHANGLISLLKKKNARLRAKNRTSKK